MGKQELPIRIASSKMLPEEKIKEVLIWDKRKNWLRNAPVLKKRNGN